jgi:serine/threonine protein kinase
VIAPGTVLAGRYSVVRHIGSGGMASVYLAEDATLERQVAVKRIHADPESELGRRIHREARLGAGLRHPNVVTIYDVVADGEALLLIMEYVDGETLADALGRGRSSRGARWPCCARWRPRWSACTRRGSCTATSSRPTSC